jgi:methylamine--corrinoid protein Co-methyltransferase
LPSRRISDKTPPFTIIGATGAPASEAIWIPLVMSYCNNGQPDSLNVPGMATGISGQIAKTNSLIEAYIAKMELRWLREAIDRIGRPGMSVNGGGATVVTRVGTIATTHPAYRRPSDSFPLAIMNELKTDYDRSKVVHNADYGGHIQAIIDPIIGGLAGGPEGAALVAVASALLANLIYGSTMNTLNPVHRKLYCTSNRMCLWLQSIVGQAFARNQPRIKCTGAHFLASGPGEMMLMQEVAANSIATTVSGLQIGTGPASAQSKYLDHLSGLEGHLMCEVSHSVARSGWTREQANETVNWLLQQYENRLLHPPIGKTFQEIYDVIKIKPIPAWQRMHDEMITSLEARGLEFIT